MNEEKLKNELERIITKYIGDIDIQRKMISMISKRTTRGLVYELDKIKLKNFTDRDHDILKDIIFYYG